VVERSARSTTRRRSTGWILAYAGVALAAWWRSDRVLSRTNDGGSPRPLALGGALAVAGYPVGRRLLGDRPEDPPPEPFAREALALAAVVAPAEELAWGSVVEPALGVVATSVLFAAKHVAVDGRWRRSLGLALFWGGLGLLRRRSRTLASFVHAGLNLAGVVQGHLTGRDRF
jgi:hypothetical protein